MARTQTLVQLTDEIVGMLDGVAGRRRSSRSAVIREAIEEYLARDRARLVDERMIAGYLAVPQAVPDEWGDIERLADLATYEVLARLDHDDGGFDHGGVPDDPGCGR